MSSQEVTELNFGNREMQKSYYEPVQTFPGYYGHENGYGYDLSGPMGVQYPPQDPSPPNPPGVDCYRPSCYLQQSHGHMNGGENIGPSSEYSNPYSNLSVPVNPCMQPLTVVTCSVSAGPPGPAHQQVQHPASSLLSKPSQEIYPWMRESRQNPNKRQNQVSDQATGKPRTDHF